MTASMTLAETVYTGYNLANNAKMPTRKRPMAWLVAGITAFAMIIASAAPAHADRRGNDALKTLAAIAAIAIIAKAVKKNKHHTPPPIPVQSRRVPGVCAIEIGSGRGSVTGYGERCLREEGFDFTLPSGCSTDIRIYGRADKFFPEECLNDAGFITRTY